MPQDSLVGRRIFEIRTARKLSRQDLADRLTAEGLGSKEKGVTYLQVYRMEMGETDVSADDVPTIARVLECSIASLYREAKAS